MPAAHPTRRHVAVALFCCLSLIPSLAVAGLSDPPRYRLTDLGTFTPSAINNAGQVAGTSYDTADGESRAVLYSGGRVADLGTLTDNDILSSASDINDAGQVVGTSGAGRGRGSGYLAFVYSGGQMGAVGGYESNATGINEAGQVVGVSYNSYFESPFRAVLYSGGQSADLGTLPDGRHSSTSDINEAGQVVGSSDTVADGSTRRAFLYTGGQMMDLGTLPGGVNSSASAINDAGQVVGESDGRAFLWEDGRMADLGTLTGGSSSSAAAIDNAGRVVGESDGRAFLWEDGRMYDLADLLVDGGGWELGAAVDINDAGQIVGSGVNPLGERRAYLLTPADGPGGGPTPAVPLPPMVWAGLATLAGTAVAQVRGRRHAT